MPPSPRVTVFSLGGTIGMAAANRAAGASASGTAGGPSGGPVRGTVGETAGASASGTAGGPAGSASGTAGGPAVGVVPTLTGEQLVASVPGLAASGVDVETREFRQVPGGWLTLTDVVELAAAIAEQDLHGTAGVVVTQGTDTIEETAYALDLLNHGDMPVVVTGAMRHPAMAGADGPGNILAAVQTAASQEARGLGCLVVFADQIHSARYVRKVHATSPAAFASPGAGLIRLVAEGTIRLHGRPTRRTAVTGVQGDAIPRVALVTITLGDDVYCSSTSTTGSRAWWSRRSARDTCPRSWLRRWRISRPGCPWCSPAGPEPEPSFPARTATQVRKATCSAGDSSAAARCIRSRPASCSSCCCPPERPASA